MLGEEGSEAGLAIAVVRMLLPDQRVARDAVESVVVALAQRTDLYELAA